MCLTIAQGFHKDMKPLIAKEDLLVIKILKVGFDNEGTPESKKIYHALYQRFTWEIFKENPYVTLTPIKEDPDRWNSRIVIDEGYHALYSADRSTIDYYKNQGGHFGSECVVMKIPKGAQFFIGESGDVVASEMILTDMHMGSPDTTAFIKSSVYGVSFHNNKVNQHALDPETDKLGEAI